MFRSKADKRPLKSEHDEERRDRLEHSHERCAAATSNRKDNWLMRSQSHEQAPGNVTKAEKMRKHCKVRRINAKAIPNRL